MIGRIAYSESDQQVLFAELGGALKSLRDTPQTLALGRFQ